VADNQISSADVNHDRDRVSRFRNDIAEMSVQDPVAGRERLLLRLGALLLVAGPVWAVVEYFISHNTRNPLQQRDAMVGALFAVTLTLVGLALFVRYSLGRFLRFWLARLSFEQEQAREQRASNTTSTTATGENPTTGADAPAASAGPGASAASPGTAATLAAKKQAEAS
jgi:hypothetical protein